MFVLPTDSTNYQFPPVDLASPEGLLAVGGDLRSERLLAAYRAGVFPWYNQGQPILWWSPDPRAILFLDNLKISRSLAKTLRKEKFQVTLDTCFRDVVQACSGERPQQETPGTWIHPEMIEAYCDLHQKGYAHSVECWDNETLVGGLYGVSLGGGFFGESMFSYVSDASKVALVYLVRQLKRWDFDFVDAQISSDHMSRMGAEEVRRSEFIATLNRSLNKPTRQGRWHFDNDPGIGKPKTGDQQ
ncbi:MAG: leucyl/phenylalanyl-tRNA--protein transferase [Thiotrichales bacterium SG8_50]|nr:MAG: leucyl/phenylalanyl-tRNA--protein transferase [Thiotrichales bacterium SG8_50]